MSSEIQLFLKMFSKSIGKLKQYLSNYLHVFRKKQPFGIVVDYMNQIYVSLRPLPQQSGFVAERLGTGLQNLLQRFKSARNLQSALQ
jgi:hypothetical protein